MAKAVGLSARRSIVLFRHAVPLLVVTTTTLFGCGPSPDEARAIAIAQASGDCLPDIKGYSEVNGSWQAQLIPAHDARHRRRGKKEWLVQFKAGIFESRFWIDAETDRVTECRVVSTSF